MSRVRPGGTFRANQWLLQAAVLALVGFALLALVFAPSTERFCSIHPTGCGLVTGFISTTLVAIAGYFLVVVWALRRAIPRYRENARDHPDRLFQTGGRVRFQEIIHRDELATSILTELEPSRLSAPIVVAGSSGSGKTTFLMELTSRIAEAQFVPVVLTLHALTPPLRLRQEAHQRFISTVDPFVRTSEQAERIWRRLCAARQIVVVVDGIDEFMLGRPYHERDQMVRMALAEAVSERLPVVISSRAETIPNGAIASRFDLEPLPEAEVVRYLEERIPPGLRDYAAIREIATVARATPYYLDVIAALIRAGRLSEPSHVGRGQLLVWLLDQWIDLLVNSNLMRHVDLDRTQRSSIVEGLGTVAYAMTARATLDSEVNTAAWAWLEQQPELATCRLPGFALVDGASRLELVDTFHIGEETRIRFRHAIEQAYFLSRLLRQTPEVLNALIKAPPTPELSRALVMYGVADTDPQAATRLSEALVERAADVDADVSLLMLVTAGEVLGPPEAAAFHYLDGPGADAVWSRATPRARLAAIARTVACGQPWRLRVLRQRTLDRDETYPVRWAASQGIVDGGEAAWQELHEDLEQTVVAAASLDEASLHDVQTHDLERHNIATTGWILPALTSRLSGEAREDAGALLDTLVSMAPKMPAAVEASLAQGFKLAAQMTPSGPVSGQVWHLLKHARFWYSRIMLAHAVCLRAISDAAANPNASECLLSITEADPHPLVVAAGQLCRRALREHQPGLWIWDDEVSVITTSGSMLDDRTARVLADVVILLNLVEQGQIGSPEDRMAREKRKDTTYRLDQLPYCLGPSRTREELFRGCPESGCALRLCPYPATADRAIARNEFSEAFCRHLAERASSGTVLHNLLARNGYGAWTQFTGRDARRFWQKMGNRVS